MEIYVLLAAVLVNILLVAYIYHKISILKAVTIGITGCMYFYIIVSAVLLLIEKFTVLGALTGTLCISILPLIVFYKREDTYTQSTCQST